MIESEFWLHKTRASTHMIVSREHDHVVLRRVGPTKTNRDIFVKFSKLEEKYTPLESGPCEDCGRSVAVSLVTCPFCAAFLRVRSDMPAEHEVRFAARRAGPVVDIADKADVTSSPPENPAGDGAGSTPAGGPLSDDREAWLEGRRMGWGASDVPILTGDAPWSSPTRLVAEKRGDIRSDVQSDRMEFGLLAENAVAEMASRRWGWDLIDPGAMVHPDCPHSRCTPDRMIRFPGPHRGWEIVEIKVCWKNWGDWGPSGIAVPSTDPGGTVPVYYYLQVQWQLYVTQLHRGWLVAMVEGDLHRHRVDRDDAVIQSLVEKGEQYWQFVAEGGWPPDDDTLDAELAMWEAVPGLVDEDIELAGEAAVILEEFRSFDGEIKRLKQRRQAARNDLMREMGNAKRGHCGDVSVTRFRRTAKSYIDQVALREERPAVAALYERKGRDYYVIKTTTKSPKPQKESTP